MAEDGGVRAPLTRRRMMLSIERCDEEKSSPAANTPTKRGNRRTAKPELDLIDENAPENITSKKTGKKTALKEIELVDDKPVTPSRRSARIKSNTSIVSETSQAPDTPRAKRASRRTSQVGSDNEATLTPARQTRRTRKDSASNIEQAEPQPAVKQITEMILEEEYESTTQKSPKSPGKSIKHNHSPSGLRQSPRLSLKNNVNNSIAESNDKIKSADINSLQEHNTSDKEKEVLKKLPSHNNENNVTKSTIDEMNQSNLSESNSELLKKLNTEPKKTLNIINKSTSAIVDSTSSKSMRNRTKSWTNQSGPELKDYNFFSDSETIKKKRNRLSSDSRNADLLSTYKNGTRSLSLKKKKKNVKDDYMQEEVSKDNSSSQGQTLSTAAIASLFAIEPSNTIRTMVYIDDSNSNSDNLHTDKNAIDEDQCVPKVLETIIYKQDMSLQKENQSSLDCMKDNYEKNMGNKSDLKDDSSEPMDVDVTIPDNVNVLQQKAEETPILNLNNKDTIMECTINEESKNRKPSLSFSSSQILEKTSNENKSTLVLSELKDISNENNVMQSPQICTENISKSYNKLNVTKEDKGHEEKKLLSNYSTSTPLQEKGLKSLAIQVNTSGITSNNSSKIDKSYKKIGSKFSNTPNKSEESVTDEESEQEESKFIDDEAEEASYDYESGDSKDEDEERYERENEILQKGETLSTEDELSNDTDYEKDSFVVSSNDEDEDLLDGSGDDLSMSDNELKMTAKSKKKYNERKMKEQKNASREMFEARHKLNKLNDSIKSQAFKVKKTHRVLDSSDEDIQVNTKKNNNIRLDSSHETSVDKSLDNIVIQKNKSLSKLITNESGINENEITIDEEIDPLPIDIKKELVTPQKSKVNDSVKFIDTEHIDEKEDDRNDSQKSARHEPLGSDASDSSDSSDNVHIQNYDSILNELNKNNKSRKTKVGDISLPLNKKTKKTTIAIVEQLNLTQTKPKMLNKKHDEVEDDEKYEVDSKTNWKSLNDNSISKHKNDNLDSDNELSNSIDLRLLFSEDSNSRESQPNSIKNNDDSFIPLQQSLDKTNIVQDSATQNTFTTDSAKKKNKKIKSLNNSSNDHRIDDNHTDVQFFVDTTGSYGCKEVEKPLNVSDLKENGENSDSDPPVEISNKSILEKECQRVDIEEEINKTATSAHNKSITKTPKSDKKKKKISESSINMEQTDISLNKSVAKTPKSDKKKKKLSESQSAEYTNESDNNIASNVIINSNTVKESVLQDTDEQNIVAGEFEISVNKSISKTPKSEKKKKKTLSESKLDQPVSNDVTTENDHSILSSSKKQKSEITEEPNSKDAASNSSLIKTPKSEKKKAKISEPINDTNNAGDSVLKPNDNNPNRKKNKGKLSHNQNETSKDKVTENIADNSEHVVSSKKRKRSLNQTEGDKEDLVDVSSETTSNIINEPIVTSNVKNKRRKVSHNTETTESKNKDNMVKKKENKKRKEREDDEDHKVAKVLKINSFDKVNVPRLPKNILNQLEDQPRKKNREPVRKSKAISTSNFIVEETKIFKTKPSNYLEESVYLNEDKTLESKKPKLIKAPKVLPFLPTVSTSNNGCTTNFRVNTIPKEFKFVAGSSNVGNFRNEFLENKKLKRLGSFDLNSKKRNVKLSKF